MRVSQHAIGSDEVLPVGELHQVKTHAKALMCDSGVENFNNTVDDAPKETGVERILAQVDDSWINSAIEVIWQKVKHDWLFINRQESFAIVERLVASCVDQDDQVI